MNNTIDTLTEKPRVEIGENFDQIQLINYLRGMYPKYLMLVAIALAACWSAEIFLIQELTFKLDSPLPTTSLLQHYIFRFTINFLLAFGLITNLPRLLLAMLMLANACTSLSLYTYYVYFKRPLSALTFTSQAGEGLEAWASMLSLIPLTAVIALSIALIAKIMLIYRLPNLQIRRSFAFFAPVLLTSLLVFSLTYYRPIEFGSWRSNSYWGHIYGYTPVWANELLNSDSGSLLRDAENAKRTRSDLLSAQLPAIASPKHVVIIQAESLDFDAVHLIEAGRKVMPFLANMAKDGILVPVTPVHLSGSADADFVLLSGHMPNGKVPPYLPGLHIDTPLPKLARRAGFRTEVFHGNRGTFFNRRMGFEKMCFGNVYFQSELIQHGLPQSDWGVADHEVLKFAAERLKAARTPILQFLITLTTHSPWIYTPQICGHSANLGHTSRERLISAMRYLDDSLANFYDQLPEGTLLLIYGDHNSGIPLLGATSPNLNHVPFILKQKGTRLARVDLENVKNITMLDVASYVRNLFSVPCNGRADEAVSFLNCW